MALNVALTTIDNEWDPFTQFKEWWFRDTVELGYNTCGRIASEAKTTDLMSDAEYDAEVERAMDMIVRLDFMNIYRKVRRKPSAAAS